MLNDSGLEIEKEYLDSFLEESFEVLDSLKECVTSFSSPDDNHLFEKFCLEMERIRGGAYTLPLNDLGNLAQVGKELSAKAGTLTDMPRLLSMQSLLSQLVKALEEILLKIKKNHTPDFNNYRILLDRLKKANAQLGNANV